VIGVHLYLVIKNGVSEPPTSGEPVTREGYREHYRALQERGRSYFPYAMWREAIFAIVVVGIIVGLAVFVGPKALGAPPDPTSTNANPRPDWYMLWIFALLAVIPPQLENLVILLLPLTVAVVLILIPFVGGLGERSLVRRPWAPATIAVVLLAIVALLRTGFVAPWSPRFDTQPISVQALGVSSGPAFEGSRVFYENGCQFCHNAGGQGGQRGPNLTHITSRLNDADIAARILAAPEGMPSYAGKLDATQIDQIVAFLHQVDDKGRQTTAAPP
jgi:ubiquinol-cytochrome c reductase cytochrome b subunit